MVTICTVITYLLFASLDYKLHESRGQDCFYRPLKIQIQNDAHHKTGLDAYSKEYGEPDVIEYIQRIYFIMYVFQ